MYLQSVEISGTNKTGKGTMHNGKYKFLVTYTFRFSFRTQGQTTIVRNIKSYHFQTNTQTQIIINPFNQERSKKGPEEKNAKDF